MTETLWPADDIGIPLLRLDRQAPAVVAPWTRWGARARKSRMPGTWHFYTDDYRFSRLLSRPTDLTNSACSAAVEPNISIRHDTPHVVALHSIYRKRLAARTWQEAGVHVLVDLHVAPRYLADNLRGVPRGWRSYATRGNKTVAELVHEAWVARGHAGGEISLVVYGGPASVRAYCEVHGWLWLPEEADVARGRAEGLPVIQASDDMVSLGCVDHGP